MNSCLYRNNGKKEISLLNLIIENIDNRPDEYVKNINCFSIINKNKNIMSYQFDGNIKNLTLKDSLSFHEKINQKILFLDLQEELISNTCKLKSKI